LLSILLITLGHSKYIGKIYYDSNTRTVYVNLIVDYDNPGCILWQGEQDLFGGMPSGPFIHMVSIGYPPF